MIDPTVALSIIRGLSGMEGFPFHEEGQKRYAGVLIECCIEVSHARAVIAEYEGDTCPSLESLRTTALRLNEKCGCGIPLWNHAERGCQQFSPVSDDEWKENRPSDTEMKAGWKVFRSEHQKIMDDASAYWDRENNEIKPAILRFLGQKNFFNVSHNEMAFAKRELGVLVPGYYGGDVLRRDADEFEKFNPEKARVLKLEGQKRLESWRVKSNRIVNPA